MEPRIGEILTNKDELHRDAIHIAIIPAIAGENLYSGCPVYISSKNNRVYRSRIKTFGIVDPFLIGDECYTIPAGTIVYIFLIPKSIRNLRHNWDHPELDKKNKTAYDCAVDTLTECGHILGLSYEALLTKLTDILIKDNNGIHCEGFDTPDVDIASMLDAFTTVTSIEVPESRRQDFYVSCSC